MAKHHLSITHFFSTKVNQPNSLVQRPPWLYASSVKNKQTPSISKNSSIWEFFTVKQWKSNATPYCAVHSLASLLACEKSFSVWWLSIICRSHFFLQKLTRRDAPYLAELIIRQERLTKLALCRAVETRGEGITPLKILANQGGAQCVELKLRWHFCVHTSTCHDIYL